MRRMFCRPRWLRADVLGIALVLVSCTGATKTQPDFEPTESYQTRSLEGFTLRISGVLLRDDPAGCRATLDLLRVKLFDINRTVPAAALARLHAVPIWIEREDRGFPCMCYHPSRQWLTEHDYNPDKAGGVEIANVKTFQDWTHEQPWMVLHELAHAFHDQVLGFDDPAVKAAYDRAARSHKYDAVLYFNGKTVRAYAMTNPQEFFAECSEAYFGTNDFYPFVRAELEQFDPETFALLDRVWRDPPPARAAGDK